MTVMVTIHRAEGLRIVIFVDDHEPAHVHAIGAGEAKINLLGPGDRPELIWADDMKLGDVRRAMRLVTEHQDQFLARWRDIHG